jgi:hypothetical protein
MFIVIKRRGSETARVKIERLVSTLGFGEDCDVSLDESREDQKLGMLIQQGDGLSFRPLKQELKFFLGDIPVDNMMPLAEGEWLSLEEFELCWVMTSASDSSEPEKSDLPPLPKPLAGPAFPNRAGAMMAYGHSAPGKPSRSEESLELSDSAKQPESLQVPPPKPVPVLSESKVDDEVKSSPPAVQKLSSAEVELMEKLRRLETDKKPTVPQKQSELLAQEENRARQGWKETENDILGPAWKRVVKYFYHHIEHEIFSKKAETKMSYMHQAIQDALDATTPKEEHDVVRPRVERELESASPFDRVGLSSDVHGMRVTDKGLLSMDRGEGFGAPEMSFYNGGHVCWSFDRWLQANDVEKQFTGTQCQSLSIGMWTVNAFFEPFLSSGFLIQFQKTPKVLAQSLKWSEKSDYDFLGIKSHEYNLLVVGKDHAELMRIFYLLQSELKDGQILGVIGDRLKIMKDESRFLFLDQNQSLSQIIKVSDSIGLFGMVDFEVETRGKTVFQQIAFKNLSFYGFSQARQPIDALRRFELQWRLSNPQSEAKTIREWIQASFPYIVYLDREQEEEVCRISSIVLKKDDWFISEKTEDDWE